MAESRTYNGFVYTRNAPGEPWQKTGPASIPANPLKVQGAQADVAGTQASTARTRGQEARDAALFEAERRKAMADAVKAEMAVQETKKEGAAGGLDRQKLANLRAVENQIARLSSLFNKGPAKTKGLASVLDYVPGGANARLDAAGAGMGDVAFAAFRTPGAGSQSDAELRAFIDANRPSSWDFDVKVEEKLNNLRNRLNETYSAYGVKRKPGGDDGWKIERLED